MKSIVLYGVKMITVLYLQWYGVYFLVCGMSLFLDKDGDTCPPPPPHARTHTHVHAAGFAFRLLCGAASVCFWSCY
jgi:hypothetical protein